ncbi:MAG: hypothetical protein MO846_10050 [Candidatus Devosia symbiotica]|nr:hypothetical protein [Candidatus Devosia symbiotica]
MDIDQIEPVDLRVYSEVATGAVLILERLHLLSTDCDQSTDSRCYSISKTRMPLALPTSPGYRLAL